MLELFAVIGEPADSLAFSEATSCVAKSLNFDAKRAATQRVALSGREVESDCWPRALRPRPPQEQRATTENPARVRSRDY